MMIFINLLIGQLPDAAGLLLFGIAMIGSSVVLRRIIAAEPVTETEEISLEERS
jgi:hypothetical protein